MNSGGFFTTFETGASSVWDAWKKIETSVDASLGLQAVSAQATVASSPSTPAKAVVVQEEAPKVEEQQAVPVSNGEERKRGSEASRAKPEAPTVVEASRDESQLMRLAARNAELERELDTLKTAAGGNKSGEALMQEFSARLGQVETRLRVVTAERDGLKKEIESVRKESEGRTDAATKDLRELMGRLQQEAEAAKAAEQTVRAEGVNLAKQVGKLETVLKSVRAQLTDKTAALEVEVARASNAEASLNETQRELAVVKEELKKWEGSADSLKTLGARAAGELSELKASDAELKRKLAESQQALETAWADLASFRKDAAQKLTDATEAARQETAESREKWKRNAQQKAAEWAGQEKSLKEGLQALRAEVARKEESYEWRIHALSEKERELKSRLEQTESSLLEERASRAQAQAPLIEETRKLREAVRDAEDQIALARNEGRAEVDAIAKEKRELRAQVQQLEAERDKWRDETSLLSQKLARVETRCAEAFASVELERSNAEQTKEECETMRALSRKLKEENDKFRAEHAKIKDDLAASQARLEGALNASRQAMRATSPLATSTSSPAVSLNGSSAFGDESPQPAASSSSSSSFALVRLEREVAALQAELVRASREASEAVLKLKGMAELERMLADLGKRHLVALEILGERENELRAAREDLQDAKEMFRTQILELTDPVSSPLRKTFHASKTLE
jgi:chromosome segregation ATPase